MKAILYNIIICKCCKTVDNDLKEMCCGVFNAILIEEEKKKTKK